MQFKKTISMQLASFVTMLVLVAGVPAPAFVAFAEEAPPAESSAPAESAPSSDSSSSSDAPSSDSGDTGGGADATGGEGGTGGDGGSGANGGDAGQGADGGTADANGNGTDANADGGNGGSGGDGGNATTGDAGNGGTGGDGGTGNADSENTDANADATGGSGGSGGTGGSGENGGADAGTGGNGGAGADAGADANGDGSADADATGGNGGSGGDGGNGGPADGSGGGSGSGSGGGSGDTATTTGDVLGASDIIEDVEGDLGDTATSTEAQDDLTGENVVAEEGDALIVTGRSKAFGYLISLFNIAITNSTGNILFLRNPLGDALDFTQRIIDLFSGLVTTACNLAGCDSNDDAKFKIYTENEVEIKNELVVSSLSGENRAHSTEGDATIDTGDALAYGGIVNFGNLQLVDSRYLILLMHNEGDLSGDILLPDGEFFKTLSTGATMGRDSVLNVTNDAGILNNGTTTALTGDNTALSTEGSDITTGDARAKTTVANFVNQIGAPICFVVSVGGDWNGSVVQMPEGFQQVSTDFGHLICGAGGGQKDDRGGHDGLVASTTNYARILNDAIVEAKTGANIAEGQSATIETGDADAFLSILNVVNQTIIGQDWIFAMFNVAGDWNGDLQFGAKPGEPDILGDITDQVIGGGGGGGGGGGSSGGNAYRGSYYTPNVVFTKEASVVQVSSPAQVEYVITVDNQGQGLRKVVITDALLAPDGKQIGTQKWDLGVLRANEVVTIKYTVDFGANIKPGYYKNTAKMTGLRENGVPLTTLTAQDVVEILPTGEVLSAETCAPLLTEFIRPGKLNTPAQVMALQTFLNTYEGEALEVNGRYDSKTLSAVMRFQSKYATDILAPWGISRPTGNVYYTTQKKVNEIACKNEMIFALSDEQINEISHFRSSVKAPGAGLDELLKKNETGQVAPKQNVSSPKPIQSVSLLAPKQSENQFGLPLRLFSGLFLNLVPFVEAFEL